MSGHINDSAVSSATANRSLRRHPKVNIKEICEKFEKLSSSVEKTNPDDINCTPVAPVRRKKLNFSKSKDGIDFAVQSSMKDASPSNSSNISSIKEKSKVFETPIQSASNSVDDILKKSTRHQSNMLLTKSNAAEGGFRNSFTPEILKGNLSPPVKPPRSFLTTNVKDNCCIGNEEIPRKYSLPESPIVNEIISKFPHEMKVTNSVPNLKAEYGKINRNSSRLNSVPEIMLKNSNISNPKTPKVTGKTQPIIDCFKNISNTVTSIPERVSGIFVDLTPTTVSPPKHYGTLKKSLSDEHIYAEPSSIFKSESMKSENKTTEPLHYMSCSIVPPALPKREKDEDDKFTHRQSVRNMIYGSFAGVRGASKGNSDSNTSNGVTLECSDSDVSTKAIEARIIYVKSVRKQISASSMCLAPKLYEALLIVNVVEDQPQITYSFPLKIAEEYRVPLLPHICFPVNTLQNSVSVYQSETFHFALTEKEDTIFGYCLRIQGWPDSGYANESLCIKVPVVVCILSSFSAPVFYKKLLFEIEKHLSLPRNKCFKYVRSLHKLGVPNAGASLSIPDFSEKGDTEARVVVTRPLDSHFVGLEMTRALQLLDVDILVKCVASLFLERRILFLSTSTSDLYYCCKAISSLLYPFEWPHAIVPVLPACLTVQCCSDQPYIYGILNRNSVLELLIEHELLIIDVDKGCIIKSCNDEDTILPKKVQKAVLSALNLAKNMTDPTEMLRDIMISEAFVHMSVEMIGHYENHFTETNGNTIFQKEAFLKHAFSHNIRSFLAWFSETQMFDTFIEESLWRMRYRKICQTNMRTFFEKRVDEYKWELSYGGDKLTRFIGKTVRNFGEKLRGLKKC